MGPWTVTMPAWPGPLLAVVGAVLAIGSLTTATLAAAGQIDVGDPSFLGWLAIAGALLFGAGLVYVAVRQLRVRRGLPLARYRGPSVLLLLALAFVIASLLTAPFSADAAALVTGGGELSLLGAIFILLSTQAALLLVGWLFVYRPNALAALPSFPGKRVARAVLQGIGWGVVAWIGSSVAIAIVVALLQASGIEPQPETAEVAVARLDPWLVVLGVVILAPIAEEAFFRGIVFNAWLRERGRRWAFIGSAALFAFIHLSIVSLVPIFLLGLGLAWVYQRSGTLLAPMVMHATVNGISVLLAFLVRFDVVRLPV